jgi:uncharacterized membrane protein
VLKTLQRHFLTGLLAVTPLAITSWVLVKVYQIIDRVMRPWLQRIPGLTETYPDFALTLIAMLSFVLLIVIIGLGTRSLVGRAFMNLLEGVIHRIPFVKTIFMATKQIASVFLSDKRSAFQTVVLFEYPRRHCYSIGFVTHDEPDHTMVNVFLPTTPNPTSGYMLLVPREQTVVVPLTVEDGIKLIISGGSIMTAEQAAALRQAGTTLHAGDPPWESGP